MGKFDDHQLVGCEARDHSVLVEDLIVCGKCYRAMEEMWRRADYLATRLGDDLEQMRLDLCEEKEITGRLMRQVDEQKAIVTNLRAELANLGTFPGPSADTSGQEEGK